MNITLRGKTKQILENMVGEGYSNTLSEAVRLAIISFGEKHTGEKELVSSKLDRIDEEIAGGRRKTLSAKEALGAYSNNLK